MSGIEEGALSGEPASFFAAGGVGGGAPEGESAAGSRGAWHATSVTAKLTRHAARRRSEFMMMGGSPIARRGYHRATGQSA
ncbi:MAG TPA: hypothetical protein VK540_17415 [Polyangiaceae bacterium]|nr:hypothetical protein [Polyangiaceae bacterium]